MERPIPLSAAWWSLPSTSSNHNSYSLSPEVFSAAWWMAKIPKGFENFGVSPDSSNNNNHNKNTNDTGKDSATSSTDDKKTSTTDSSSGFLNSSNEKSKKSNKNNWSNNNNNKRPNEEDDQNIPGLLALLILVLAARNLYESESHEGQEITFVEFRNRFLLKGQVERLEVINEKVARVVLKPDAVGASANHDFMMNGGTGANDFDDANEFTSGDTLHNSNTSNNKKAGEYYFYVGSVESLEQKLAAAQQEWHPSRWVEVQYLTKTDWAHELLKMAPMILMVGTIYFMMRGSMPSAGGAAGGGGPMGKFFSVGKSTAKKFEQQDVSVRFSDVAGCEQAKKEIVEFVDFLKHPERFTKLGARIPKGALLAGPPGTGKTLLAKAVAGEAGVPFFSVAGSDFLEMFVGVGPSRVRDLFKEARKNAPSIIFIDEIDAVGRQRGRGGFSGGADERDNTLNQMLVEMDGFSPTTGVVVLAGTNRADILDQALTRPGRFDRQITVDRPDLAGRKGIFTVHLKGITIAEPENIEDFAGRLAGLTPGFSGADIANICNEAAIVAARREATAVEIEDFEKATDRVIGGLESTKIISEEERKVVAYHEAGHAVAGWFLEHCDPLMKVTIIPRSSGALGFAQYLPKEVYLRTKDQILDMVAMALAGRAAEDVFFGRVTTGASDDLKRVTEIAYGMIMTYGMNARVGQLAFSRDETGPGDKPYAEATQEAMDEEARAMVDEAYQRTVALIRERQTEVEKVAQLLLDKETITHDDVMDAIGPRPFEGDAAYKEYVSMRKQMQEEAKESDESKEEEVVKKEEGEGEDHDGGFTPTPGFAFK